VTQEYLRQAFAELEQVKRSLEPQLDRVLREAYKWHCTAQLAIKRQQEDLAKAALLKKYPLKQEALQLQAQLDEVRQLEAQLQQLLQRL
jgi:phage shock protein A